MEPMFENSYVRTRKIHKEFYRYFCFRQPLMIAVYIVFGVSLAANLVSFFCGQGSVAAGVSLFPWCLPCNCGSIFAW